MDAVAGRAQPTGITAFREHCHTSQRAQNPWASRRTGSLALGPCPPGPNGAPLRALCSALRFSCFSWGGKGGKAPTFYTLSGVDCGVLASSSDFPFADLSCRLGCCGSWDLFVFLFEFMLDPFLYNFCGRTQYTPSLCRARALPEQVGCGPGGSAAPAVLQPFR